MKSQLLIVFLIWILISCANVDFATIEFSSNPNPTRFGDTIYVEDQQNNGISKIFSATITGSNLKSVHFSKSVNGGQLILLNSNLGSPEYSYSTQAISRGLVEVNFYFADIFYDSGDIVRFEIMADNDGNRSYAERFLVIQ